VRNAGDEYAMFATGAEPDVVTTAGDNVTTGVLYVCVPITSEDVLVVTV